MCILPDRKIHTLDDFIKTNIKLGSIIVFDGYPSYPQVVKNNRLKHIIVPHIDGFVNSDGETTNKIENLWSHLKSDIRKENGIQFTNIDNFLVKFAFRKKFMTGVDNESLSSVFIRVLHLAFNLGE